MGSRSREQAAASKANGAARRIVALVLPELLVELAERSRLESRQSTVDSRRRETGERQRETGERQRETGERQRETGERQQQATKRRRAPLGVVLVQNDGEVGESESTEPLAATVELAAVNAEARRYGVQKGQTVAEAGALLSGLVVCRVSRARVKRALESVAEAAMAFGATISVAEPDTIWVDVTGAAHLFGGEAALASELAGKVRGMGHVVRVAVANGPVVARMLARWAEPVSVAKSEPGVFVVPSERTREALQGLPMIALPLADEMRDFLVRLGVLTIAELMKLPAEALGPRLGSEAARVLEIGAGRDREPLVPFQPARSIVEETSWDHEATGNEPLLFALRGLVSRVSARLSGRGEAAQSLVLTIEHARAFTRFRGTEPTTQLRFALSSPVHREEELRRIVSSRLERVKLPAPSVGLKLEVPVLTEAMSRQLEFGEFLSGTSGAEEELPLIVAELVADLGEERVGVLEVVDSHRPEAQSKLGPVGLPTPKRGASRAAKKARDPGKPTALRKAEPRRVPGAPTRLLPEPLPLSAPWHVGAALTVGERFYTVERIVFDHRLEGVEWWSRSPVARDYVRLWLSSAEGVIEALAFIERGSQRAFLHAIAD